ncbi:hypothetical protein [Streptomyces sp. NPDC006463]|uniref:hypothetical protein n=1 Tax=Streptomyces sp. NPDC006463 TaxID=3364746 RepID=UPI0036B12BDF
MVDGAGQPTAVLGADAFGGGAVQGRRVGGDEAQVLELREGVGGGRPGRTDGEDRRADVVEELLG